MKFTVYKQNTMPSHGAAKQQAHLSSWLIVLCSLLICSCPTPDFTPEKLPQGFGSFSLSVDVGRTILPAVSLNNFAAYTLAFTATSGGTSTSVDRTGTDISTPVILAVGTYDLTISAYMDTSKTKLAAQGTETGIVIDSGSNVSKSVTLKAISNTGSGTFAWNINITASGVTSAVMAITQNGAPISNGSVNLTASGATTGSLTLSSGKYNVTFTLEKNDAEAVWNEILYVYAELTSNFPFTFDNDFFYRTHYTVTYVYNDDGATQNSPQSVLHGGTLASTTPTRTGYGFAGWHTDTDLTVPYIFTAQVYKDFFLYAKWEENSPDNPYLVTNETELRYVGRGSANPGGYQNWTVDKHYKQTVDITLSSTNWTAIGSSSDRFTGSYNGDGHTITNLNGNIYGMFAYIGTGGKVENLGLINVSISGDLISTGGIAGTNNGTIQNCYVTGSISAYVQVGGIAGTNNGTIQNCYFIGDVAGIYYIGGIAGDNDGTIQNCYAADSVTASGTEYESINSAGGIVGYGALGTIRNCIALNKIVTNGMSPANIGRIVGNSGTLQNNYAWSGMTLTVEGSPVTATSSLTGIHGEDITAAAAKTDTSWTTATNWNSSGIGAWNFSDVWQWNGANGMPSLSGVGTVQAWPGYLVDPPPVFDPATWIAVTNTTFATSYYINGITWGDDKFVAVGGSGKMAYSDDGISWTAVPDSTFSTNYSINGITWGDDKFVAVGGGGKMAYSNDGISWTAVPNSIFNSSIMGITWGNGIFVATCDGKMAYSTDGINWSAVPNSTFVSDDIRGIIWGENKFVAGGYPGKIGYSTDGISWNAVSNSTFGTSTIWGVAYGNGTFVAVGNSGQMAYSDDGINWSAVSNSTFNSSTIAGITWSNDRFVAVGDSGKIAYSVDGISWTAVSNSTFGSSAIMGITYGNGKFVAVGGNGKMAYSVP